jgi:hypothetical protein
VPQVFIPQQSDVVQVTGGKRQLHTTETILAMGLRSFSFSLSNDVQSDQLLLHSIIAEFKQSYPTRTHAFPKHRNLVIRCSPRNSVHDHGALRLRDFQLVFLV